MQPRRPKQITLEHFMGCQSAKKDRAKLEQDNQEALPRKLPPNDTASDQSHAAQIAIQQDKKRGVAFSSVLGYKYEFSENSNSVFSISKVEEHEPSKSSNKQSKQQNKKQEDSAEICVAISSVQKDNLAKMQRKEIPRARRGRERKQAIVQSNLTNYFSRPKTQHQVVNSKVQLQKQIKINWSLVYKQMGQQNHCRRQRIFQNLGRPNQNVKVKAAKKSKSSVNSQSDIQAYPVDSSSVQTSKPFEQGNQPEVYSVHLLIAKKSIGTKKPRSIEQKSVIVKQHLSNKPVVMEFSFSELMKYRPQILKQLVESYM